MKPHAQHRALRECINAIRPILDKEDVFGQFLTNRMLYREGRATLAGTFHAVRELYEAVKTAGGNLMTARAWANQAVIWSRTGKALDQKFARYEVDTRCARAMDALLHLISSWPDELQQSARPEAVPLPVQIPVFPSTPASSTANKPAGRPTGNPFGTQPPTPPAPPAPPPPGSRPPLFPTRTGQPASPPPNPFGQKPAPPSSPFGGRSPFGQGPESLPFHVATCFDILSVTADAAPSSQPRFGQPPAPVVDKGPLPADLTGLVERLIATQLDEVEAIQILSAIGKLNDLRSVEMLHRMTGSGLPDNGLIEIFGLVGGDAGLAGLVSLLPVDSAQRPVWLAALLSLVQAANKGERSLSAASRDLIWQIACAEASPDVDYCPAAVRLLAATGRREAIPLLWEHAMTQDVVRQRTALYGLTELNPVEQLPLLLMAIERLPDVMPQGTPPEVPVVRIPFETLEAVLYDASLSRPKVAALLLLSYINDPRVIPLLVKHLTRRVPRLREVALNQLRRLNARDAADAIAALMERDETLRVHAAQVLRQWGDARSIPALLNNVSSEDDAAVMNTIRTLGDLPDPHFDAWLAGIFTNWCAALENAISEGVIDAGTVNTLTDRLCSALDLVVSKSPRNFEMAVKKLSTLYSIKLRLAVVAALGRSGSISGWKRDVLCEMVRDRSPLVAYRAAATSSDVEDAHSLLASSDELRRVLAVRIFWTAKDTPGLVHCLSDKSAAVRALAAASLSMIPAADYASVAALQSVVETSDHVDCWHLNPAVLAWRGLARLNKTPPLHMPQEAAPLNV